MTTIKFGGGRYKADKRPNGDVWVEAKPGMSCFSIAFDGEEDARRWLGDRGLRKSKARQLLDAELRGTGPMVNPRHPNRIDG